MEKRRWPIFVHVTIGIVLAFAIVVITNFGIALAILKSFSNTVTEFLTPLESTSQQPAYIKKPGKLIYSPLTIATPNASFSPEPSVTAQNDRADYPPEDHPHKWDYIESKNRKCWFHKTTRDKICIDK